jgi:hypothetical protein
MAIILVAAFFLFQVMLYVKIAHLEARQESMRATMFKSLDTTRQSVDNAIARIDALYRG